MIVSALYFQTKKERIKVQSLKKKEIVVNERQNEKHIIYGLGHTTLFQIIYPKTMIKWRNQRFKIFQAAQMNKLKSLTYRPLILNDL